MTFHWRIVEKVDTFLEQRSFPGARAILCFRSTTRARPRFGGPQFSRRRIERHGAKEMLRNDPRRKAGGLRGILFGVAWREIDTSRVPADSHPQNCRRPGAVPHSVSSSFHEL